MRRATRCLSVFLFVLVIFPSALGAALGYAKGWPSSSRTANWASSGILPRPQDENQARIVILSARTGRWKGIFAEHMAIIYKPENAKAWTRYEVVGWGEPIRRDGFEPDALWYGNMPRVIFDLKGKSAADVIPDIEAAISHYPYAQPGSYIVWPGPNSNTFVSWIVRHVEGLDVELPPVAVGKDWLGYAGFARAPSDTGYTVSLAGILGATLAWEEGAEIHFLGSTIGLDWNELAIKLPALGKLGLK
jgi:Protein of unknown function (DUF3750)